ncbi:hypothetical protein BT93_H3294 [Corymbia citriodora subsp. variegata]|nr:hypothetical protein BT93_H3294 [Corymbia citriodora subsp. variegata]
MSRQPYPPCLNQGDFPQCFGGRCEWPELVGQNGEKAKAVIEKENTFVTVKVLPDGMLGIFDHCINRVYVYLDENGIVQWPPRVG